jgi:hypothetical protein
MFGGGALFMLGAFLNVFMVCSVVGGWKLLELCKDVRSEKQPVGNTAQLPPGMHADVNVIQVWLVSAGAGAWPFDKIYHQMPKEIFE